MKFIKNRFVLFIICAALAGVIGFVVIPGINAQRAETTTVYRATAAIAKGEVVDEGRITEIEVGALGLPEGYLTDKEAIVGKTAQTNISSGDLFFPDKLGDHIVDRTLDDIMAKNNRLVTVSVQSTAAGLSGHLERGDIVSVAVYIPEKQNYTIDGILEATPAEAKVILRGLSVYDVENARTVSVEEERKKEGEEAASSAAADIVPKTVTLVVDSVQALRLIEAEYSGQLHLIFERRNSDNG